ncbi:hypothetical protein AN401_07130 [Zobellella denitrificans]|uniref:Uncharacterized protein n=1 Tax=Zobellella denitrificans TaxID=347534 RepID=A0A291HN56_9GAMM|nr:hypothetical protein [Zobellella denitrificans]ATG73656.1 hypothetical protein AN401_07130 [Zobellella denitrificans]
MSSRRWKNYQPSTLRSALEGCKEYAREQHNLSVERIAADMGLTDHWVLYKWISSGRMPAPMVIAYERVCGINLVSRWMAAHTGKLLIDMPTGRKADAEDIQGLQQLLHSVTGLLMEFYAERAEAEPTLAGIQNAMQALAWHKGNVQQHASPQLEF